jgi:hypothetical protein
MMQAHASDRAKPGRGLQAPRVAERSPREPARRLLKQSGTIEREVQ